MKESTRPPLRGLLAIVTLALAAWLCWQCIDIYVDGTAPENLGPDGVRLTDIYTAADVAQRLQPLLLVPPVYALLIVGALVAGKGKEKPLGIPAQNRLAIQKRLLPEGTQLPEEALQEQKLRRWVRIGLAAALVLCAVPAGMFLLDGANFVSWDLEIVMGQMLVHVLPWAVLALALVWAAEEICCRSMARETAALKALPREGRGKPAAAVRKSFSLGLVRVALLGVAIVFILLGVMNGGLYDVLVKAINICTECIGLG